MKSSSNPKPGSRKQAGRDASPKRGPTSKRGPGRPKSLTPCPYCERLYGAVEFRLHIVKCRKNSEGGKKAVKGTMGGKKF